MELIFKKGNKQSYFQDGSFFKGVPHNIKFKITFLDKEKIKLTAPGYGQCKNYGNGNIFMITDHLTKAQKDILKESIAWII